MTLFENMPKIIGKNTFFGDLHVPTCALHHVDVLFLVHRCT